MASVKRPSTDPGSEGPGPSTKQAKTEESFSFPTSFEDELAFLESVEQEEKVEATNSDPSDSQSSQGSQMRKWKRPPPPSIDPSSGSVTFQQIEIDHYIGEHIPGMPGVQGGSGPILRMFGVKWLVIVSVPMYMDFFRTSTSPHCLTALPLNTVTISGAFWTRQLWELSVF